MPPTAATAERAEQVDSTPRPASSAARGNSPVLPLVVDDLSFRIRDQVLVDRVSFTLEAGPTTVILGPNGAGKSLLLKLCDGLLKPSGGDIRWRDMDPRNAHRWVAMVFQRPMLLRRSVAANVGYALAVKGMARRKRRERVQAALDATGLDHLARRSARVLSGGEQQRVAIARAWVLEPQVLLLDEPTSNLDPLAISRIEELIRSIRETGTRIIMTTHDLNQARRLSDEVLFMHQGRLLEHTPAEQFFTQPRSQSAAAFIEGRLLVEQE